MYVYGYNSSSSYETWLKFQIMSSTFVHEPKSSGCFKHFFLSWIFILYNHHVSSLICQRRLTLQVLVAAELFISLHVGTTRLSEMGLSITPSATGLDYSHSTAIHFLRQYSAVPPAMLIHMAALYVACLHLPVTNREELRCWSWE